MLEGRGLETLSIDHTCFSSERSERQTRSAHGSSPVCVESVSLTRKESSAVTVLGAENGQGLVLYCFEPEALGEKGLGKRLEMHRNLVGRLLRALAELSASEGCDGIMAASQAQDVEVIPGPLGRPLLRVGGRDSLPVSFAHGRGRIWAALGLPGFSVGIDVAEETEFPCQYPFERAFHRQELAHVRDLINGTSFQAAALIWSAKESVVKALGCGFHLVDPLDLWVTLTSRNANHLLLSVQLMSSVEDRRVHVSGGTLLVRTLQKDGCWLSVCVASLPEPSIGY
ncbi:MAG: 4'-phosphopantetheinyl transferase superfamily protein [Thermodesulfobacteriota bacterium]